MLTKQIMPAIHAPVFFGAVNQRSGLHNLSEAASVKPIVLALPIPYTTPVRPATQVVSINSCDYVHDLFT